MKFKKQAHVVYGTIYHIVWVPKRRYNVLVSGINKYLEKVMDTYLVDRYPDVIILEINIQSDHIHIMIEIPPKYSVSKIVCDLKSNTSRELRKRFDYLRVGDKMLWSIGYFVSTVGLNEKITRDYIKYQNKQDSGRSEIVLGKDTTGEAKRSP